MVTVRPTVLTSKGCRDVSASLPIAHNIEKKYCKKSGAVYNCYKMFSYKLL